MENAVIMLKLVSVENFVISGWPDWIKMNLIFDAKTKTVNKLEITQIHDEWDEGRPENGWDEIRISSAGESGNTVVMAEQASYDDVNSGGENRCNIVLSASGEILEAEVTCSITDASDGYFDAQYKLLEGAEYIPDTKPEVPEVSGEVICRLRFSRDRGGCSIIPKSCTVRYKISPDTGKCVAEIGVRSRWHSTVCNTVNFTKRGRNITLHFRGDDTKNVVSASACVRVDDVSGAVKYAEVSYLYRDSCLGENFYAEFEYVPGIV